MTESKLTTLILNGQGGLAPESSEGSLWHHVKYTDKKASKWIKSYPGLSDLARMTLLDHETRPRAHVSEQEVLLCLRGINFNEEAHPEDMISIRIWVGVRDIITSASHGSQSIRNMRALLEQNIGPINGATMILGLIDQLAHLTDEFVDKMDLKLDDIEDQLEHIELSQFNPMMSQIRRQTASIRRYLLPQKDAIDKLYRNKHVGFTESFYDQLYLHMDRFLKLIENLDLMRERSMMLQEQYMAIISHQQNSRLYILAIVSAIFLPLTFLSGLFGMNVAGLPGTENPAAFNAVIGFSVGLTVLLLIWFKKSRWF
ncbi:zinc transporter ZntB [Marinicella meishanensis]|uniref:zinc transporter ZntB n=1 Tax=Marinicella meishanensis TaxID=2873263 RepID=UPI001CBC958F|nr:zinc transporter ZntB [Marinicella sp. NBU2979]